MLRTLADCRRLLANISHAGRVAVIGGSFIGLEAAASLRSRGLGVEVVVPQTHPMEKLLGRALSDLILDTLANKGITFHLGRKPERIEENALILDNGDIVQADAILVGVGVSPNSDLAQGAGLKVEEGVVAPQHRQHLSLVLGVLNVLGYRNFVQYCSLPWRDYGAALALRHRSLKVSAMSLRRSLDP